MKTTSNFINEQKAKFTEIEIPVDDKITATIMKAAEDIKSAQEEQKEKFMQSLNNNLREK